jgi:hypothetical protein
MKLLDKLLSSGREDKLAHFYILESGKSRAEEAFKDLHFFTDSFIARYYQEIEKTPTPKSLIDHPDVLWIGSLEYGEDTRQSYQVDEAADLARFLEFKPIQAKRKFVVITEADKVGTTVANKWLKILEEPSQPVTIFMLNPKRIKLLPTLLSRAQSLILPGEWSVVMTKLDELMSLWKTSEISLSQFIEKFKDSPKDIGDLIQAIIDWETTQYDEFSDKKALAEFLIVWRESEVFRQSAATRSTLLYAFLKSHILPRYHA